MNKFRVSVGSVLFLAVAITCVLLASHKSAAGSASGGPDVTIAGPLPLPVTGTLGFAPGSAVTVNNPASTPVLVRGVDHGTPFQMSESANNLPSLSFGPVPASQRWIIEHVSGRLLGTGSLTSFNLETPGSLDLFIPQTVAFGFLTSSQTKFIVDPGQTVSFTFGGNLNGGSFQLHCFISGVIVSAP